jgi:hypothetical protein
VSLLSPAPFPVQECICNLTVSACGSVPDPCMVLPSRIMCMYALKFCC